MKIWHYFPITHTHTWDYTRVQELLDQLAQAIKLAKCSKCKISRSLVIRGGVNEDKEISTLGTGGS